MCSKFALFACLLLLGSCSSPPKPLTVDESRKRPANSAAAVDLQVCKSDLQNTRILATESGRVAETVAATSQWVAARQQVVASQVRPSQAWQANSVFSLRFDFGSSRVVVPADIAAALIDSARAAPLILLRGRTDGSNDSLAESRIARERANAVREYLVSAGVDPARIRATYQPTGDFAVDNASPTGRGMNRRVEVEIYRALPVAVTASTVATSSSLP